MPENRTEIPQWLRNLQENSWEVELLISGGAVFTLIQVPDYFIEWLRTIRVITSFSGFAIFLTLGLTGIKVLTNGFILHLLLRSYWLSMVCLNYIFPGGIRSGKVNRKRPFGGSDTEGDLHQQILFADRMCGLVVFMSIAATFILLGLAFLFVILLSLGVLDDSVNSTPVLLFLRAFVLLYLGLYVLDLFLMGFLRRIPVLSWLLFPVFKLYDWVTFRFVFGRPLALFSSNVKRGSFITGALLFSFVTLCTIYMSLYRTLGWSNLFDQRKYLDKLAPGRRVASALYKDEAGDAEFVYARIPSKIIEHNYLEVNLRYGQILDDLVDGCPIPEQSKYLSSVVELRIDDSVYTGLTWRPNRTKNLSETGILTMVSIEHLANGQHSVSLGPKPFARKFDREMVGTIEIPFWKDVH